jgi:hypothetical protein
MVRVSCLERVRGVGAMKRADEGADVWQLGDGNAHTQTA